MSAMRTTIRLKGELLEMAKRKAASQGRTLTAFIEDAVRNALLRDPAAKTPIAIPVSSATGGFRPGFDPVKINQQIEELEDIERHAPAFKK